MATAEARRQASIVQFWRAVEYFSPQAVDPPKQSKGSNEDKGTEKICKGRDLPWERPPKPLSAGYVWRYTVYAGIFDIEKIRDVLQSALPAPEAEPDTDGRIRGQSALLSLTLDDTGRLYRDSANISSCAWALGRTVLPPGPGSKEWLEGFEDHNERTRAVLFEIGDGRIRIDPTGEVESGGKRALRAIAGVSARVAIDVATGGLASVAGLVGSAVTSRFGSVAGTVAENIADSLADDASQSLEARFKDRDGEDGDGPESTESAAVPKNLGTKVLAVEDLAAITRWVAEDLGVDDILEPTEIWVKSFPVPIRHADDVSGDDIINSFYAKDLDRVSDAILDGDAGTALTEFLRSEQSIDNRERVDLRQQPQEMLRSLTPTMMPLGRWPAKPDQPLTLSQQFAVNRIVAELGEPEGRGIYAVNGPPGTGKTTMLRDLVAAVVVQRALLLAELPNARAAFQPDAATMQWNRPNEAWTRKIVPLVPALTGFEIVVASSNNGAVENITMEVPSVEAVDRESFPEADYFSGPATMQAGEPCWGAVAARLGNRANRTEFVKRVWWGNRERGATRSTGEPDLVGLHRILKPLADAGTPDTDVFDKAVASFRDAVETVHRLAEERQRIARIAESVATEDPILAELRREAMTHQSRINRLQDLRTELAHTVEESRSAAHRAEQSVVRARRAVDIADMAARQTLAEVEKAERELYAHAGSRPGWVKNLFSLGGARSEWRQIGGPFYEAVARARDAATVADEQCAAREAEWHETQRYFSGVSADLLSRQQRLEQCDRELGQARTAAQATDRSARLRESEIRQEANLLHAARERWPGRVPGDEWAPLGSGRDAAAQRTAMERREKSSPWMDEEFAAARSRAFLAALDLHRAVLTAEPKLAWTNLCAVIDVVSGDVPPNLPEQKVLAAWQMLFFVMPVVSTTFASLPTMFNGVGREALGWLFIDEAGQATPQAAVGALWRTRRAVVVGDPLQLEPVVTLPWQGQQRLYAKFGLTKRWAPQITSVQGIADRVSTYGTWLSEQDTVDRVWVGSPLRVHRRCDRLMFEVSNAIAYDGMMVYGTAGPKQPDLLERNVWIDVHAHGSGDKWNPEDGRYVVATLNRVRDRMRERMERELAELDGEPPKWSASEAKKAAELNRRVAAAVFVVSPFRVVANRVASLIGDRLPYPRPIGTVHTTQGKEAEVVILVLGTANDQDGSRAWAAKKPNLLNVAVTRAKRRLVVIGDHQNWSGHRNFQELAGFCDQPEMFAVVPTEQWPARNALDVSWRSYEP